MRNIIWLASYPKSGNTWVRAFIHNYRLGSAGAHDINRLSDLVPGENVPAFFAKHDSRPAGHYTVEDVRRLRPLVHHDLAVRSLDPVLIKTHNAFVLDTVAPVITPEVTRGAIYLVRDPRDVAVSFSHHIGEGIDWTIDFMAAEYATIGGTDTLIYEILSTWTHHVRSWTTATLMPVHIMRYEDMVTLPMKTFSGLLRFLGEEPDRARLDRALRLSSFKVLQAQERRNGFVERSPRGDSVFFRDGRQGGWRRELSEAQAAQIERRHGDEMRRFGYL